MSHPVAADEPVLVHGDILNLVRASVAEAPEPGPDEVAVKIDAFGINFADTMVRRGEYRRDQPLDFTPGFEATGRVVASPGGTPAVGERVIVFNDNGRGYADLLVVPAHRGHRLGLAVKVANQQALYAAFPELSFIITGNADVNTRMNAINDRLGFRVVERCLEVEKSL